MNHKQGPEWRWGKQLQDGSLGICYSLITQGEFLSSPHYPHTFHSLLVLHLETWQRQFVSHFSKYPFPSCTNTSEPGWKGPPSIWVAGLCAQVFGHVGCSHRPAGCRCTQLDQMLTSKTHMFVFLRVDGCFLVLKMFSFIWQNMQSLSWDFHDRKNQMQ